MKVFTMGLILQKDDNIVHLWAEGSKELFFTSLLSLFRLFFLLNVYFFYLFNTIIAEPYLFLYFGFSVKWIGLLWQFLNYFHMSNIQIVKFLVLTLLTYIGLEKKNHCKTLRWICWVILDHPTSLSCWYFWFKLWRGTLLYIQVTCQDPWASYL